MNQSAIRTYTCTIERQPQPHRPHQRKPSQNQHSQPTGAPRQRDITSLRARKSHRVYTWLRQEQVPSGQSMGVGRYRPGPVWPKNNRESSAGRRSCMHSVNLHQRQYKLCITKSPPGQSSHTQNNWSPIQTFTSWSIHNSVAACVNNGTKMQTYRIYMYRYCGSM